MVVQVRIIKNAADDTEYKATQISEEEERERGGGT